MDPELFEAAQETLRQKFWRRTNEQVLETLKSVLKTHGRLSHRILLMNGLSSSGISYRFGSLGKAYDLIGFRSLHQKTARHRLHVRMVRAEMMH